MMEYLFLSDPDARKSARQISWGLTALIGFMVSGCSTFQEIRYGIWGKTIDATVTRAELRDSLRRGASQGVLVINYSFPDNGDERSESASMEPVEPVPTKTIGIDYIPGVKGASRPAGSARPQAILFFVVGLIGIAAFCYEMHLNATQGTFRKFKRGRR